MMHDDATLKIAVCARDAIGTGGGTVAIETATRMSERGHEVVFVSDYPLGLSNPQIRFMVMPFGETLHNWRPKGKLLSRISHLFQVLTFAFFASRALRSLEKQGFITIDHNIEAGGGDIVVLHNVFDSQAKADARPLKKRMGNLANPLFWYRLHRERRGLSARRLQAAIGVSHQACLEARPLLRSGVTCIPINNGIDLQKYSPTSDVERRATRRDLGVDDKFVVVFIGHEFERKRLDLALAGLALCNPDTHLWCLGGRFSNIEHFRRQALSLGVEGRVTFWGTREDTPTFLRASDCFILPSDYETWGMVTLEAMACGVVPIMTRTGCATTVIRDDETGYIVDQDAESIANAILRLRFSPMRQVQMRRNVRVEAEKYGWDAVADQYLGVVETVSNQKNSHVQ